jgi:hypothetical protein
MATDIVFFLAPDDASAAGTRLNGPGQVLTSLNCHDFDPDDAVVEWETYFDAPSLDLAPLEQLYERDWPCYIAPVLNDGIGVFAVPDRLTSALANAAPGELRELAARWTQRLRLADGDDMTGDNPLTVLDGLAQLAVIAESSGGGTRLYCRHD